MKLFTITNTLCTLALFGAVTAPIARADAWNRKTVVTFSGPVEIPGVHASGWEILPAGTYVFKVQDSQSNRHIVQIFNKEETQLYATILAIPNYRLKATDKTVMTFSERAAGEPEALRAWFYPGRNYGEEFVYPKSRAIALAKATNTPVLYTPVEILVVTKPAPAYFEPAVAEYKRAPIMAVKPTGEDIQLAEVVTPPPADEVEVAAATPMANTDSDRSLPSTASELPLLGLLGFFALGSGLFIRSIAKTF